MLKPLEYTVDQAYSDGRIDVSTRNKSLTVMIGQQGRRYLAECDGREFQVGKTRRLSDGVLSVLTGGKESFTAPDLDYASQIICAIGEYRSLLRKSSEPGLSESETAELSRIRKQLNELILEIDPESEMDADTLQSQLTDTYRSEYRQFLEGDSEFLALESRTMNVDQSLGWMEQIEAVMRARESQGLFEFS